LLPQPTKDTVDIIPVSNHASKLNIDYKSATFIQFKLFYYAIHYGYRFVHGMRYSNRSEPTKYYFVTVFFETFFVIVKPDS
jgi:hypothetical protein